MNLIIKRIRAEGFIFTDYGASFPEMYAQMYKMIGEKKLVIVNDVREGLENAGTALRDLFAGMNKGKMCIKL